MVIQNYIKNLKTLKYDQQHTHNFTVIVWQSTTRIVKPTNNSTLVTIGIYPKYPLVFRETRQNNKIYLKSQLATHNNKTNHTCYLSIKANKVFPKPYLTKHIT